MVGLLRLISWLILVGGFCWGMYKVIKFFVNREKEYSEDAKKKIKFPGIASQITMIIVGLLFVVVLTGAVQIPPAHMGVVENSWTGQMKTIRAGTHIWPFSLEIVPLVTRVYVYTLREQIIEIGEPPEGAKVDPNGLTLTQVHGVASTSQGEGQIIVFFRARGYAAVNPEMLVELHRRYGPSFLTSWVEQNWIASLKAVQGKKPYDFVKEHRQELADLIEKDLQSQLIGQEEKPLVLVSQLTISDFDYEKSINDLLAQVSKTTVAALDEQKKIEVNNQIQAAKKVEAETSYLVAKRNAEATQIQAITLAEGEAQALKLRADAEAYQTKVKYEAEATGIRKVQEALAASPEAYLRYQETLRWNGQFPTYYMVGGNSPLPVLTLPKTEVVSSEVVSGTVK